MCMCNTGKFRVKKWRKKKAVESTKYSSKEGVTILSTKQTKQKSSLKLQRLTCSGKWSPVALL